MKYFITGGTGFIGRYVIDQLLDADHEIVALVRDPASAAHLAERGVTLIQGDIRDKESMRVGMQGVDGVFHLAAYYDYRNVKQTYPNNVDGTRNVLELMQELNIPKGVYTSTTAVFSDTGGKIVDENYYYTGKHLSSYDHSKWLAHYEIAAPMIKQGLPLVIVHPSIAYGPGDTSVFREMLVWYLKRILPVVPGPLKVGLAHVEDVAWGCILAMQLGVPGENYVIGGELRSAKEYFETCREICGIPLPLLTAPRWLLKLNALLVTPFSWIPGFPIVFMPETLRISTASYTASNTKAERELGWRYRPLKEGLRETLAYELKLLGKKANF